MSNANVSVALKGRRMEIPRRRDVCGRYCVWSNNSFYNFGIFLYVILLG